MTAEEVLTIYDKFTKRPEVTLKDAGILTLAAVLAEELHEIRIALADNINQSIVDTE